LQNFVTGIIRSDPGPYRTDYRAQDGHREFFRTATGVGNTPDPGRACLAAAESKPAVAGVLGNGHDCRRLHENAGRHTPQHCSVLSSGQSGAKRCFDSHMASEALSARVIAGGEGGDPRVSAGRVRWAAVSANEASCLYEAPPRPPIASQWAPPSPPLTRRRGTFERRRRGPSNAMSECDSGRSARR